MAKFVWIGQGNDKRSLEHLIVPESYGELKKQKNGAISRGYRSQPERVPKGQIWNNISNKMNIAVFDYNSKYKVNTFKSILIQKKINK